MKWWINAAAAWTFAHLPGGAPVHELLRQRCGELATLERSTRFDNALSFLHMLRRWCGDVRRLHVVELGTGWITALPLVLLLCGARVETCDVQRLAHPRLLRRTLAVLRQRVGAIAAAAGLPEDTLCQRIDLAAAAPDFDTACESLGGRYLAPCDTRQLPLPNAAADVVLSNLVLQCIPTSILHGVLAESRRVLRPGGFAVHRMRLTDEYARTDPRRNHLAYLTYSERDWNRWFCHRLKHQNRLRASQFLTLFSRHGFDCRWTGRVVDRDSFGFLQQTRLADEFHGLDLQDLATVSLDVVLQCPSDQPACSPKLPQDHPRYSGELRICTQQPQAATS